MLNKRFKLSVDQLQPLVVGMGLCFATDRITVDGCPVGYLYREPPDDENDSGWRFLAGDESQEYIDNTENTSLFHVNVIANYDPRIIPLLNAGAPIAFAWDPRVAAYVTVSSEPRDD